MNLLIQTMMQLVRGEICQTAPDASLTERLSADFLEQLYVLSKHHDIAHLIGSAIERNHLLPDGKIRDKFQNQVMMAAYRYEQLNYEHAEIYKQFERAGIPFIPLKGSVIRDYYPEPWMRTSCDIDILVSEKYIEAAKEVLVRELLYKQQGQSFHDVSFFSPSGVHVELHFELIEEKRINAAGKILSGVWELSHPIGDGKFQHVMSDAMFYFYHIAHMAKHFEVGGCGVRPFIDLWFLDNKLNFDKVARDKLLAEGGLLVFAIAVQKLSRVWFSDAPSDDLMEKMQEYILKAGVYGDTSNKIAVHRGKKDGKFSYIIPIIWLPYESIKLKYPILQKYRWLTPFYEIRRWFELLFGGKFKNGVQMLKTNNDVTDEQIESTLAMLERLGLV